MSVALLSYVQKDAITIRNDWLRTVRNGLQSIGQPVPNTGPGSDYAITATAYGNEGAVIQANNVILADQLLPDTAAGDFLDRWLRIYAVSRRAASQASGVVTIVVSVASTLVPAGSQCVDSTGQLYNVTVPGLYGTAPGLSLKVPVTSVLGGKNTNHANGDTLRWVRAPAFCQDTVTVGTSGGTDGLSGGADSEATPNDEPPRARLLAILQNPPKGGNSADIEGWAAASSPDVQAAFIYPALQGPGTVFFVVTGAAQTSSPLTSTSKNRDLPATLISGTVVPYVQGLIPEHVYCIGASVTNQPTDIALLLSLPAATTASPPGPGGGWLDGTPWPSTMGGAQIPVVTGVNSSVNFQVALAPNAPGPQNGVSRIAWISPQNWTLYTAIVTASTGPIAGNLWTITIDTPMPGIATGNFIFPQSVQQANYLTAVFAAFAQLGPGEWTTNAGALQRAFRHPTPSTATTWPYALDANFLRAMEDAGPEVLNAQFLLGANTKPTVPAAPITVDANGNLTSGAPSVIVPQNIGWFAS